VVFIPTTFFRPTYSYRFVPSSVSHLGSQHMDGYDQGIFWPTPTHVHSFWSRICSFRIRSHSPHVLFRPVPNELVEPLEHLVVPLQAIPVVEHPAARQDSGQPRTTANRIQKKKKSVTHQ
jgi:hypothetical protein